jgi:two-component system chemotaxis response regulator CheB
MNGFEAMPKILQKMPKAKVIISSSMSGNATEMSMLCLKAGAMDYIFKPSTSSGTQAFDKFADELLEKIRAIAFKKEEIKHVINSPQVNSISIPKIDLNLIKKPTAIAIGSSTGGPQALIEIFSKLKGQRLTVPIFIAQHMPVGFTKVFAEHLAKSSGFPAKEGENGEIAQNGTIYISPGDYHMVISGLSGSMKINLTQDPPEHFCRPSVNPMFRSLANILGKNLVAFVLTGMGSDGFEGCEEVREKGGLVIAQDKETCVVWGMPKAITEKGVAHHALPLMEIAGLMGRLI